MIREVKCMDQVPVRLPEYLHSLIPGGGHQTGVRAPMIREVKCMDQVPV